MRKGSMFVCDRCGETAPALDGEAPARWIWAFGFDVHACSERCWSRVQKQHRRETGKVYISDRHEYPAPVDLPPASFTINEAAVAEALASKQITPGTARRQPADPHLRARGEPRIDAGEKRIVEREVPPDLFKHCTIRGRRQTFLYFAQEGEDGPIKIGVSADPLTRLSSLQVSNVRTLRLLATRPGTGADERELHRRLAEHRIRGEWFAPAPAVLSAVTGA